MDAGAGGGVLHHHALLRVLLQLAAVARHQLVVALHAAARVQLLRPRQLVAGLLAARAQLVAGAGVGEGGGGVVLQGAGAGQRAGVEAGQLGLGVAVSQQRHGEARLQGPQRRVCEGDMASTISHQGAFSVSLHVHLFVLTLRWMTEYWSVCRDCCCCPEMSSNSQRRFSQGAVTFG